MAFSAAKEGNACAGRKDGHRCDEHGLFASDIRWRYQSDDKNYYTDIRDDVKRRLISFLKKASSLRRPQVSTGMLLGAVEGEILDAVFTALDLAAAHRHLHLTGQDHSMVTVIEFLPIWMLSCLASRQCSMPGHTLTLRMQRPTAWPLSNSSSSQMASTSFPRKFGHGHVFMRFAMISFSIA